ncbi:MAG: hypothetical protein ACI3ZY_03045 [Parabacteroides sp.]
MELVGIAVGHIGMSLGDTYSLTMDELLVIYEQWKDLHEREERARWERMRMLAQCMLMPHSKKPLKATDIFKFPWDSSKEEAKKATRADFERMAEMFG